VGKLISDFSQQRRKRRESREGRKKKPNQGNEENNQSLTELGVIVGKSRGRKKRQEALFSRRRQRATDHWRGCWEGIVEDKNQSNRLVLG